jgi:uncharacterized protein
VRRLINRLAIPTVVAPLLLTFVTLSCQTSLAETSYGKTQNKHYIAIIIDDLGYNLRRGRAAIEIPAPLTYAILPNSTHAALLADRAFRSGKEIMLHLPMENSSHHPMGAGVLTRHLHKQEFLALFDQALSRVPHAIGINNHMGSALTEETQAMTWLMKEIKHRQMYFVDSRTTPRTVAFSVARSNKISAANRDVFLDNDRSFYAVDQAFQRLLRISRRKGTAIGIGHPHAVTLAYLQMAIPQLVDVEILPVSKLIAARAPRHFAATDLAQAPAASLASD